MILRHTAEGRIFNLIVLLEHRPAYVYSNYIE